MIIGINHSKSYKIGGVSGRFGVGILFGSKVAFAVRLTNGEIRVFSQIIPPLKSKIFKLPFIRALLVFRQIFLVFRLSRYNLKKLSREGLINLKLRKRIFNAILFIILYIGSIDYLVPIFYKFNAIIRILLFISFFIIFIRLFFLLIMSDQCLKYHGAEHKVINTFLAHESLTLPNVKKHSRLAFRCGTTLATFLILISIIIPESMYNYMANLCGSLGCEVFIFIFILGIAYEILELFSRPWINKRITSFLQPLNILQYLTTREPSLEELKVSLAAIQEAVGWWDS